MSKSNHSEVVKGALLLSLAALFAKVLSAVYRIPFQNLAGDYGFYVYQQTYPFYGMAMILALYGFPVVISRQVAEKKALGLNKEAKEIVRNAFVGLILFSTVACLFFILYADTLAAFIGDTDLAPLLRLVGLGFLFIPILSVLRGFGQGEGNMGPTAFSHVGDQLVRVFAILGITYVLVNSFESGAYEIGKGAIYGSLAGSVVGIVVLFTMSLPQNSVKLFHGSLPTIGTLWKTNIDLFKQSIFICLNALVLLIFQAIDVFTVVQFLHGSGMDEQVAYLAKGIYDRGQPLIQIGTILTTTVALALVPLLAKSLAAQQLLNARMFRDVALRISLLIGGGASIGLVVLMDPINHMLFTNQSDTHVLQALAVSILPASIYLSGAAILQGYGRLHVPVYAIVAGLVVKIVGNGLFISLFQSTMGAALATVLAFTVMMVFVLYAMKQMDEVLFVEKKSYFLSMIVLVILGIMTYLLREVLVAFLPVQTRMQSTFIALFVSTIGGVFVVAFVFFSSILTKREWASVPQLLKIKKAIAKNRKRK
ncbi:putative polysaccharide biosynthesis protein [Shouchella patagoniensis]|uniref:putative polysaccharide biosynthesis protein n=1 Tax=Shouchella patagoniensis TaxID=228576 RepID=UPI00099530F3|nr:polysaccharide biosynthesis protein [Shouchella patagoniensis]